MKKNRRKPLQTRDNNEDALSLMPSEHGEFADEETSAHSSQTGENDSDTCDSDGSHLDEEDRRLKEAEEESKRLAKLEKDSQHRVERLEKRVQDKSREEKKKQRRKSREYQERKQRKEKLRRLEEENERRLKKIEELNKMEDHLSEVIAGNSDNEVPPSSGECRDLLHRLVAFKTPQPRNSRTGVIDIAKSVAQMAGLHPDKSGEFKCDPYNEASNFNAGAHSQGSSRSRASTRKRSRSPVLVTSDTDDDRDNHDTRRVHRKGKKLQSGKTAKFDDTDIRRVVRYPHSKLNQEFTNDKTFDELTLNTFVAGELEIISRVNGDEHMSRIKLLTMIMYHSQYATFEVIKQQYDMLLKRIEREELEWDEKIELEFDRAMERRIRIEALSDSKNTNKNSKNKELNDKKKKAEDTYYCLDYNKGNCTEPKAHKGKLGTREVLKQHICHKCWQEKAIKVGHPEFDDRCPYKSN